ncbi:MAG: hypothetical protein RL328_2034 [Acidobacteriota bacterium]|jgi:anti-anti-sigma factor
MLDVRQETRGGWCIVVLSGRADATVSDSLETSLVAAVQGNPKVAVDLSGLDYVSSAGLRSFLQAARAAQEAQGEFIICSPKPSTKTVLEVSGMQHIVKIEEKLPC